MGCNCGGYPARQEGCGTITVRPREEEPQPQPAVEPTRDSMVFVSCSTPRAIPVGGQIQLAAKLRNDNPVPVLASVRWVADRLELQTVSDQQRIPSGETVTFRGTIDYTRATDERLARPESFTLLRDVQTLQRA